LSVEKRFADTRPSSFDKKARSVIATLSTGGEVARFYGREALRISPEAVGLSRMKNGSQIPLLDSHQSGGIANALGRVTSTWFARDELMGKIAFNETPNGELAMGMVERHEITGISIGYAVREWEITDDQGDIVQADAIKWNDDLVFTATRWDLHEASLVSVPADPLSGIRSMGSGIDRPLVIRGGAGGHHDVRFRMLARERMAIRARMVERAGRK
jgi:HK97 family phage prohead protease